MATNFTLTLDTTGPAGVSISLEGGAAYATAQAIIATIGTSDSPTTGYQMKIWGNVDTAANANIQATEGASNWISYSTSQAVTLSSGDGSKTVNVRIRDDVYNESSSASDAITLDTTKPVPNVTVNPDLTRISKIAGKRVSSFSWEADTVFDEYKIKVVPATGSLENAGTVIPTTNGSTNITGTAGGYPATTNINSTIDGRDLEAASAGDGDKIIKIFVKDPAGNWSL